MDLDLDLKQLYRERDEIMNMPDEDLNEYRKRMFLRSNHHATQSDFAPDCASYSGEPTTTATKDGRTTFASPNPSHLRDGSSSAVHVGPTATRGLDSRNSGELSQSRPQQQLLPGSNPASSTQGSSHLHGLAYPSHHTCGRSLEVPKTTERLDEVSSTPDATEENVEEMRRAAASTTGVKRKLAPNHITSPAKRQKGAESGPVSNDFPVRHTFKPPFRIQAQLPTTLSSSRSSVVQIEEPSEIKTFTSSPEPTPQEPTSSGQSSPITSFSLVLTRSPSSDLRQQAQILRKRNLVVRTPPDQLSDGVATFNSKTSDAATRRNQQDETDPPTSPIEDSSIQDSPQAATAPKPRKGIIPSTSTKLCLEVKERVARHAAMKRRDKVIPIGPKGTNTNVPAGPSTGEDQVRRETSVQATFASSSRASSSLPRASKPTDEAPQKPKTTRKTQVPVKQQKKKNNGKEKQEKMTPIEYAQLLLDHANTERKKKSSAIKFLEGKHIFYIGGDMQFAGERTRGRMELIVKHGGNLVPAYDSGIVTHIITDASKSLTLRALGYKRLSEIPDHIPTVTWDWILSAFGRIGRFDKEEIQAKMEDVWLHAAFGERIDTTVSRSKAAVKPSRNDKNTKRNSDGAPNCSDDLPGHRTSFQTIARIATNEKERPEPSSSGVAPFNDTGAQSHPRPGPEGLMLTGIQTSKKGNTADPLEEFYAEAKAARDANWSRYGECEESDEDIDPIVDDMPPTSKRGWTCDQKEAQTKPCANQDIIDKLQELQELHKAKLGDENHWRAFSYNKSIRALRAYPKRIQSYNEARSIRGVGDKTALKIIEILQTGDLRRINYEKTDDVKVTRLFQGIYGVGQSTAFKWYSAGCRTLEDLRSQKGGIRLNPAQLIGLQYYDDINNRMPRSEARAIFDLISPIALSLDPKLFVEIMGSYRRGKVDCGDIDILITRPTDDDRTHSGILSRLLPALHKAGILTEDLAIPEDFTDLECVYRGLCRLPQPGSRRRRIDFLTVPWQSRGAALLYYTGDDIFNRAMRLKANKMGYSLNQRGLYSGIIRDPRNNQVKLNEGTLIASETEEEIFRILNVPWQDPHERVRG